MKKIIFTLFGFMLFFASEVIVCGDGVKKRTCLGYICSFLCPCCCFNKKQSSGSGDRLESSPLLVKPPLVVHSSASRAANPGIVDPEAAERSFFYEDHPNAPGEGGVWF
ncbi:hypothetical protein HN446_01290 [bacterium]|jgi:hypothetical protein|nr:hypothetical protein [bacterium]